MADLIDRAAAIDAIEDHIKAYTSEMDGYNMARRHMRELIEVLPSAQQEQHWIPCSDKLPDDVEIGEEYPTVIFCTAEGTVHVGGYEHYLGGKWWYMDTWEDEAKGVIAWMPLPEPWRGEET